MKNEHILDAIGSINDEAIRDAKVYQQSKSRRWVKWGAMAACLCLLVVGAISLPMLQQGETPPPSADDYPYNDGEVLDYIGSPLNNLQTEYGTIIFNEIKDIEAYRQFNTAYGFENKPYYSTRTAAYDLLTQYPVSNELAFHNLTISGKNGGIENHQNYNEFLEYSDKAPQTAEIILNILENNSSETVNAYYNADIDMSGISFNPESNCIATLVVSKDLSSVDERFAHILPILQGTLGTENSTYIGEQEIAVHYFYQNRQYRETKTEEAYQYYAYFEKDGLQYLYQFSSNWSLIGQDISAMHNPPSTLHYVETQEECRHLFAEYLPILTVENQN